MCAFSYNPLFCSRDLDLHLMTLTYESDLDIVKTYHHIKNHVSRSWLSTVRVQTGQTDRQTDRQT